MSHTPGPWRVGEMCGGAINIEAEASTRDITVGRAHVFGSVDDAESNAALIAAAPELLARLIGVCAFCPVFVQDDILKLIAKAEGR